MPNPIDKSTWGPGPWQDEPDEVVWSYGDVPCRIVRHPRNGQLNGYVGIPPSHPWYGKDLTSASEVDVHGGITFSSHFDWATYATKTDGLWWIGFDCHHAWDLAPGMRSLLNGIPELEGLRSYDRDETYRTIEYVTVEVENLAQQAIAAMRGATHREPSR